MGFATHWGIENRLRWGGVSAGEASQLSVPPFKDVVLGEDAAPLSNYNAATNWSIIRNIAINLARLGGYDSLTKAERILAHDIDKLFLLLEWIIPGATTNLPKSTGPYFERSVGSNKLSGSDLSGR